MQIRDHFPFFKNNQDIVYLDSAATSQKPQIVIEAVAKYLIKVANPGRNSFGLSLEAQENIEKARNKIAVFFGAKSENLALTTGATNGMNIVTDSLAKSILADGDEILLCDQDHKATILPWLDLAKNLGKIGKKIKIVQYKLDPFSGLIDVKSLENKLTDKTKFLVLTHAHNVYGVVNPISEITTGLSQQIITVLDMAQTAGHIPVSIKELAVDIAVFSGHKMFSLEGVGGLFASDKINQKFTQINFGGGVEKNEFPYILEVGTKNTVGILSLGAVIDFLDEIKIANVQKQVTLLTKYLLEKLQKIGEIEFMPGLAYDLKLETTGIISFKLDLEIAKLESLLQQNSINIRIGDHCTQNLPDSFRVSLHAYNSYEDIDHLIHTINLHSNF